MAKLAGERYAILAPVPSCTRMYKQELPLMFPEQMAVSGPDYSSSDCEVAARHIEQGMDDTRAQKKHPLTLARIAYGAD